MGKLILILFFIPVIAFSSPLLEGVWESDVKTSMEFNIANSKMSDKQTVFLKQFLGNLKLTFDKGKAISYLREFDIKPLNSKKTHFESSKEIGTYKILGKDKSKIAVELNSPSLGKSLSMYSFESNNLMWVYVGESSKMFSYLHIREYFKRIK